MSEEDSWPKQEPTDWPDGALKRFLTANYPGCQTAVEALNKEIKSRQDQSAAQVPLQEGNRDEVQDYLTRAIAKVSQASLNFDIDKIDSNTRIRLSEMPVSTKEEIELWRDCWINAINYVKWNE